MPDSVVVSEVMLRSMRTECRRGLASMTVTRKYDSYSPRLAARCAHTTRTDHVITMAETHSHQRAELHLKKDESRQEAPTVREMRSRPVTHSHVVHVDPSCR